jgi:hypothetical protein
VSRRLPLNEKKKQIKLRMGIPNPIPKIATKKLRLKIVMKVSFSPFTLLIFIFKKALPKVLPKIDMITGSTIIQRSKLKKNIYKFDVSAIKAGNRVDTDMIKVMENKDRSKNLER